MLSNLIKRLNFLFFEKILFYLFLFSIPFQTRLMLYDFKYRFDEYQSIFLYGTDILLILVFLFWMVRKKRAILFDFKSIFLKNYNKFLLLFFIIAFLSIIFSYNRYLSLYQLLKLLEFILLFFYLGINLNLFKFDWILSTLVLSGFFQSLIAIAQFAFQRSLKLKFLGETFFDSSTSGIAKIHTAFGDLIRAYGTFPHSNVFASFIVLAIFCLFILMFRHFRFWPGFLLSIILFFLILSLALSFSRENILTFLVIYLLYFLFLIFFLRKERQLENLDLNLNLLNSKKTLTIFIISIIFIIFILVLLFNEYRARLDVSLQEQALDVRFFYNKASIAIIKDKPILGVGLGNYVTSLVDYQAFLRAAKKMTETFGGGVYIKEAGSKIAPWLFQPVHNIYLLIASEIGIIGLIVFLIFLILLLKEFLKFYRNSDFESKFKILNFGAILIIFLVVGLSDHYFWTLQQGRIMFWLVLGMLSGIINQRKIFAIKQDAENY